MNDQNNSNFIIAMILSMLVLLGWNYFFVVPQEEARQAALATQAAQENPPAQGAQGQVDEIQVDEGATPTTPSRHAASTPQPTSFTNSPRVPIKTAQFEGSIALIGARFDDLTLSQYAVSIEDDAPAQKLLIPQGQTGHWQVHFGWLTDKNTALDLPDENSLWQLKTGTTLTPASPITLVYESNDGLRFTRMISVDDNFMFTIEQSVEAIETSAPIMLYPYGQITRTGRPEVSQLFILHEGAIGYLGEEGLYELDYDDLIEDGSVKTTSTGGWLGFTDKYWATALIPAQAETITARFVASRAATEAAEVFRSDYLMPVQNLQPAGRISATTQFFAGAKQVNLIDDYQDAGIDHFDLMIDWGWFYFITKPMFRGLEIFYNLVGNYGLSILIVTVIIKIFFFPLANRSYETMAKMKKLQPKMLQLRETYKDDRVAQQQELMKIYREEKLNPLAGCLPILLQIPVFFALYKVLFVTIDMRHQPFFGWVQDLSAADPTTIFNLFGLIPWVPPSFLMLGIWPILMGITMFVQMQMNPPPPDPVQAMIFKYMPIFFTFILASFPAGLVIYWTWNNFLSILQQGMIMRRNGVEIELLKNIGLKK